ncbi:MAG: CysB family HTH-type transcriptional regulator [Pseudomonadota bacterium]
MNFQQLRIIRETARRNFNLTDVANALFTSQSGVSKHIKDLEDELGVELFVRRGKRLLGLTEPGKEVLGVAERILMDAKNIHSLAGQFSNKDQGNLCIATTHTQARYVLPPIIGKFKQAFPRVHLMLHQGSPGEIMAMLRSGEADIAIASEALDQVPELAAFPFYTWHHAVIVPERHPLCDRGSLTLDAIAGFPVITYHEGFTGRNKIDATFARHGLSPDIVMSALDADVIKTYVELGMGIGIIASMAYNPVRDHDLRLLDCSHLFEANTAWLAIRRGHYLRGFSYRFIELCSADLTEQVVRKAISLEKQEEQ